MATKDHPGRQPRPRRGRGRARSARARRHGSTAAQLKIFEPPRFFEALLRGRGYAEVARHHRAHLRHLPGRLPDERGARDRARVRRHGRRPAARAAPAALLRRVDREPRAAHGHAARAGLPRLTATPSRWRATHGDIVRDGAGAEEDRQRDRCACSAGARSIRSTSASAASTACRRAAELAPLADRLREARAIAIELVRWVATLPFPEFERDYEFVALRHPDEYPMNEGGIVSEPRAGHRRRATTRASSRSGTWRTRPRCTRC